MTSARGFIAGAALVAAFLVFMRGVSAQDVRASWYHEGRRTATGERFNPDGLTAAHLSLPFGTMVRVTNRSNGRSVVVRINDRGPARWTRRNIDVSRGAARALGMISRGVVLVSIHTIR